MAGGLVACSTDGTPLASPSELNAIPTTTITTSSPADTDYPSTTRTVIPSTPTTSEAPISDVPPPPDSATVTCREFIALDKSHQIAVLKGVGATRNFELVADLLSVSCRGELDATIYDLIHNR